MVEQASVGKFDHFCFFNMWWFADQIYDWFRLATTFQVIIMTGIYGPAENDPLHTQKILPSQ
jgi:hypothetical protein